MYKIERKLFGYQLTFGGFIQKDEMEKWVAESKKALTGQKGNFGVFVDMRTLKPLPQDAQEAMKTGQKLYT